MKKVISILALSLWSFVSLAEQADTQNVIEVKAADYNIRIGEKLQGFGWRTASNGDKYCVYQGMGAKHFVRADTFESRKCPDALLGVKSLNKAEKNTEA